MIRTRFEALPGLRSVEGRERAVRAGRALTRARRQAFERLGDWRYSQPATDDVLGLLRPYLGFRGGVFVEAGANDGFRQSNTYFLEKALGWHGLLIEADPASWRRCVAQRPGSRVLNYALVGPGARSDRVEFVAADLGGHIRDSSQTASPPETACFGWARTRSVQVPAITLGAALGELGSDRIDLLSLDVEGHELEVLRGLDLARHAPRLMVVESWDVDEGHDELLAVLDHQYNVVGRAHHDVLLRHRRWSAR